MQLRQVDVMVCPTTVNPQPRWLRAAALADAPAGFAPRRAPANHHWQEAELHLQVAAETAHGAASAWRFCTGPPQPGPNRARRRINIGTAARPC